MVSKESRSKVRAKKHMRIRNRFSGTAERPRLAVFRSNNHVCVVCTYQFCLVESRRWLEQFVIVDLFRTIVF